nr:hypothetical protein B9J10.210 [imported] - Neurospora crassa [Neurospora crassa]
MTFMLPVSKIYYFSRFVSIYPGDSNITYKRRLARVVDVQQVAVKIQVLVTATLDGSIRRLLGRRAGGKLELGEQRKGRQSNLGDALGRELGLVDDEVKTVRVGGLDPMGLDGSHYVVVVVVVGGVDVKDVEDGRMVVSTSNKGCQLGRGMDTSLHHHQDPDGAYDDGRVHLIHTYMPGPGTCLAFLVKNKNGETDGESDGHLACVGHLDTVDNMPFLCSSLMFLVLFSPNLTSAVCTDELIRPRLHRRWQSKYPSVVVGDPALDPDNMDTSQWQQEE